MKFRVLGCYGGESPGCRLPAFLVDGKILLDAGTISSVLDVSEQSEISDILISHFHMDHICALPFFAVNIFGLTSAPVSLYGKPETLRGIQNYVLNNQVWPDFTSLPNKVKPIFSYRELEEGETFEIGEYRITAVSVDHLVPTNGYIVRHRGSAFVFTSDTGPTERIWNRLSTEFGPEGVSAEGVTLKAIVTEVSFPNNQQWLADVSFHLTPQGLVKELAKLPFSHVPVFLYHLKPQSVRELTEEIQSLDTNGVPISILEQDCVYDW